MEKQKYYLAIDLKSFYASVECMERNLDPLTTNLVVADASRTEKTICLAVSPSLRKLGIPGRARLFEVHQKLKQLPDKIDILIATPRMALYMEYSNRIYQVYLKYIAPEDIHVYSIDEVFIDVTSYLNIYHCTSRELAKKLIQEVYQTTGITATAGIGTNLYLSKVAMDIMAKKTEPDKEGHCVAFLDEITYREQLWNHRPLIDFWRVGRGYVSKLEAQNLYTMGDIARCSIGGKNDYYNEELLYKMFGVNAELLIDHAWGWEPCEMSHVKSYKPATNSFSSGQVLEEPYTFAMARIVVHEMIDAMVWDLLEKGLVTDQIVLTVGYDIENTASGSKYTGPVTKDPYGRILPKHAHGTVNLEEKQASARVIREAVLGLYDRIVNPKLSIRRLNISVNKVVEKEAVPIVKEFEQLNLFTNYEEREKQKEIDAKAMEKEQKQQAAVLEIRKRYGKNAILKGMNFVEGATAKDRNNRIGGHKA